MHLGLLACSQELLGAYQAVLEQLRHPAAAPQEPSGVEVTVSAGPFSSIDAVRGFERALAGIPGVIEVAVRGYERGDRAIVDVELGERTT